MTKLSNWFDLKRSASTQRDIFPSFLPLQREFDNLMRSFYDTFPDNKKLDELRISPSIDIVEDDKNFKVEVEMSGVGEEDINVSIGDGVLIIKAKKEVSKKNEDKKYTMREIGYGSYERIIPLPESVNIDQAKSSFKKGMLWVEIPKKEGSSGSMRELKIEKALD